MDEKCRPISPLPQKEAELVDWNNDSISLRKFSRWLFKRIDKKIYGLRTTDGTVRHLNSRERLDGLRLRETDPKSFKGYPVTIKVNDIRLHLTGGKTHYYTGRNHVHPLLLCIDIDCHEGQLLGEAWETCRLLADAFKITSYHAECSTTGRGVHCYFLLQHRESGVVWPSATELTSRVGRIAVLMQKLTWHHGLSPKVDNVYGLPSEWKGGRLAKIAKLIKIPRPQTKQELQQLLDLTPISLSQLQDNADEVARVFFSDDSSAGSINPPSCTETTNASSTASITQSTASSSSIDVQEPFRPDQLNQNTLYNTQQLVIRTPETARTGVRERDAFGRSLWAVYTLSRAKGSVPSLDEALEFYEQSGLALGPRTAKREQRFAGIIRFQQRKFDGSRISRSVGFGRVRSSLVAQLEVLVRQANPDQLKYGSRNTIRPEDLAIGLYCSFMQLSKPTATGQLPVKGIAALSTELVRTGDASRDIHPTAASHVRRILCELGLLQLVDRDYSYSKHVAKTYQLTERAWSILGKAGIDGQFVARRAAA